jgi:CRP-like cAMP-binding protein
MRSEFFNQLALGNYPRQELGARTRLMEAGEPTDRVIYLQKGKARGADGSLYREGHVLNAAEFFAQSIYETPITAQQDCVLIHIPRAHIRDLLCAENPLTWTLARTVAAESMAMAGGS